MQRLSRHGRTRHRGSGGPHDPLVDRAPVAHRTGDATGARYAARVTVAGVVLALGGRSASRPVRDGRRPRSSRPQLRPLVALVAEASLHAGLDEVVVVVDAEEVVSSLPEGVTVLLDESLAPSEASAVRSAVDWCARAGHGAVVVALAGVAGKDAPLDPALWTAVAASTASPVVIGTRTSRRSGPVRVDAQVWPLLPLTGPLEALWRSRPDLVTEVGTGPPAPTDRSGATSGATSPDRPDDASGGRRGEWASPEDVAAVEALLGRPASARFSVVVRDRCGGPVVVRNEPLLGDGTPMPTRYWLVGQREREAVGRLESAGGVDAAERAVAPEELAAAHDRYAAERDSALPAGHDGPRPTGGVGGTRRGVKCLHAHLAWYLAGGRDPVGRWVAGALEGQIGGAVAAVDCGTNSTRLLVTDAAGGTLARRMVITRLGAGVDRTGALAPEAIGRTVAVLAAYKETMDEHAVVRLRATATSAARDASNADEFFDAAERALGRRPELLTGEEEGRLSYRGATLDLDPAGGPYLVVDLGGGSTELVAGASDPSGEGDPVAGAVSLDVGCVRVTERFLDGDPPDLASVARASEHVAGLVRDAVEKMPALAVPRTMVGVAGTVATLATLSLGLDHYERERVHHAVLTRATVGDLASELLAEPAAARAARPGVEPERADVIAAGALVLAEVMAVTGHEELVVSESDILDGIAAELRDRGAEPHGT